MKSSTERSKELRARRLEAGETEIRGVFAKTEIHPEIKEKTKKLIKKLAAQHGL